ncbi:MAG: hypothetical protein KGO48_16290 [Alphaproteobacteria bacterium]|nr:hypothetical protein [Alphaproteobacteria bacterium]
MANKSLPAATVQHLQQIHAALLNLHKVLLDDERAGYERDHGRIAPAKMLQLVIGDAQFAWLRRISELIVQIDELTESAEPDRASHASDLLAQIRGLLLAPNPEDEFGRKYTASLQRLPDAVLAHKSVSALLPVN